MALASPSLVRIIELGLEVGGSGRAGGLRIRVVLLNVLVVEIFVDVFLVVDPSPCLVRVLLVEVASSWRTVQEHVLAVIANVIGGEGSITPENHLSPKVGVLARFMHGSVRFEVLLNKEFIFIQHLLNL